MPGKFQFAEPTPGTPLMTHRTISWVPEQCRDLNRHQTPSHSTLLRIGLITTGRNAVHRIVGQDSVLRFSANIDRACKGRRRYRYRTLHADRPFRQSLHECEEWPWWRDRLWLFGRWLRDLVHLQSDGSLREEPTVDGCVSLNGDHRLRQDDSLKLRSGSESH